MCFVSPKLDSSVSDCEVNFHAMLYCGAVFKIKCQLNKITVTIEIPKYTADYTAVKIGSV